MLTSPAPPHEIITVPAVGEPGRDELKQQCLDVRSNVFHYEQGFPLDTEIDEYDESENATHILLRLVPSLKPIGTIRCVHKPDGNYKLSRLAVLKEYRQYGFGRLLVEGLHSLVHADARANGKSEVAVLSHSQIPVKAFYARFGYQPEGAEFDEDGAPHQLMVLRIRL